MLFKENELANNSMDGLERQIMAATEEHDSPDQAYQKIVADDKINRIDFYEQDHELIIGDNNE